MSFHLWVTWTQWLSLDASHAPPGAEGTQVGLLCNSCFLQSLNLNQFCLVKHTNQCPVLIIRSCSGYCGSFMAFFMGCQVPSLLILHEDRKRLWGWCEAAVARDRRAHTQHNDLSTFAGISWKLSRVLTDAVTDPWTIFHIFSACPMLMYSIFSYDLWRVANTRLIKVSTFYEEGCKHRVKSQRSLEMSGIGGA